MVLCIDEMGPVTAKSYQGRQLVLKEPRCTRARQRIDYGLRGSGYVFGAMWPVEGETYTQSHERRISSNYVDFLHEVDEWVPPEVEQVIAIVDNLHMHRSMDAMLFCLTHPRWEFLFQPRAAAYLNLIEPWWKTLRSLGLKGKRFESWADVCRAVHAATEYWNAHRHPFVWGTRRRHRCCSHRHFGVALPANVA
jgi:DDE superfamily endonuclease